MGKSQEFRLGKVEAEDDGDYRFALPSVSGGDVG